MNLDHVFFCRDATLRQRGAGFDFEGAYGSLIATGRNGALRFRICTVVTLAEGDAPIAAPEYHFRFDDVETWTKPYTDQEPKIHYTPSGIVYVDGFRAHVTRATQLQVTVSCCGQELNAFAKVLATGAERARS